jgi:hypothetical protein
VVLFYFLRLFSALSVVSDFSVVGSGSAISIVLAAMPEAPPAETGDEAEDVENLLHEIFQPPPTPPPTLRGSIKHVLESSKKPLMTSEIAHRLQELGFPSNGGKTTLAAKVSTEVYRFVKRGEARKAGKRRYTWKVEK